MNTGKSPNWNIIRSSILFQFNTRESTLNYIIVDSHALNWNKFVKWNNIEEDI